MSDSTPVAIGGSEQDWMLALERIERQHVRYDEAAPAGESPVAVLHGTQPILISAPHSARHWREGQWKPEEEYTCAFGRLLHEAAGVHLIYARYQINPDPHDDQDAGSYKRALADLISQHPTIRCVIDLHGARGDRDFAVALGTIGGTTFTTYEDRLLDAFQSFGFSRAPAAPSLDRLALNLPRYMGGTRIATITRYVWERHRIPAVQVELSAWLRIARRLESATNARNGTAPDFRGDPSRIAAVGKSLIRFIDQVIAS